MKPCSVPGVAGIGSTARSGSAEGAVSLSEAQSGLTYRVVGVTGGCEVQSRLASLGILPGQRIRVLSSGRLGPVMISVHNGKLALGRGVSHKLMVSPDRSNDK